MAEKHEATHAHKPAAVAEVEPVAPKSPLEIDAENAAKAKAKAAKADAEPKSEYTRCWDVKQVFHGTSLYGTMRVLADTREEAIEKFIGVKCPEADAELKKQIVAIEVPFRPAATEVGKPGGWRRDGKLPRRSHVG